MHCRKPGSVLEAGAGPRANCSGGVRMRPAGCYRAGGVPFSVLGAKGHRKGWKSEDATLSQGIAATQAIGITLGSLDHPRLEASLSRSFSAVTVRNEPVLHLRKHSEGRHTL